MAKIRYYAAMKRGDAIVVCLTRLNGGYDAPIAVFPDTPAGNKRAMAACGNLNWRLQEAYSAR